jgi:hypothetical protein
MGKKPEDSVGTGTAQKKGSPRHKACASLLFTCSVHQSPAKPDPAMPIAEHSTRCLGKQETLSHCKQRAQLLQSKVEGWMCTGKSGDPETVSRQR